MNLNEIAKNVLMIKIQSRKQFLSTFIDFQCYMYIWFYLIIDFIDILFQSLHLFFANVCLAFSCVTACVAFGSLHSYTKDSPHTLHRKCFYISQKFQETLWIKYLRHLCLVAVIHNRVTLTGKSELYDLITLMSGGILNPSSTLENIFTNWVGN